MVNYREILRLRSMDYSQRQVAVSVQCARNTVSEVYRLADENGLSWPLPTEWSNTDLQHLLYHGRSSETERKMPDLAYLHKELAKSGVTLTLLPKFPKFITREFSPPLLHRVPVALL